jgi:hypothetical protein
VVVGAVGAAGVTASCVLAGTGTVIGTTVPTVETVVTVPVTARGDGLVMIMLAPAFPPLPVDPAQNQAEDSAPVGVTLVPEAAVAAVDADTDDRAPPADDPVAALPPVVPSAIPIPTRMASTPMMSTARRMASLISVPPR